MFQIYKDTIRIIKKPLSLLHFSKMFFYPFNPTCPTRLGTDDLFYFSKTLHLNALLCVTPASYFPEVGKGWIFILLKSKIFGSDNVGCRSAQLFTLSLPCHLTPPSRTASGFFRFF